MSPRLMIILIRPIAPKTSDSWCQHNRDIVHKTNLYVPGAGVLVDVIERIKTFYRDLTKSDVLKKADTKPK